MTVGDKRACGLQPRVASWVIVSEFNVDIWPNADLSLIPGTDRFDYGTAPSGLMRRIARAFLDARRGKLQSGVRR
jgi:hypothetical protein